LKQGEIMELTALYTFIDDFFKEFMALDCWDKYSRKWKGSRGPKRKLNLSETVTLNILRYSVRIIDLKSFHRLAKDRYSNDFPDIPNYENFLKATNKSAYFTLLFLKYLLNINKINSVGKNHFIDSTPITVCYNYNIYNHKVTLGLAKRGKSTKGWFYGFKLHGICNESGELEKIFFTPGNVHDSKTLEDMVSDLYGTVICDAGYLVKEEIFQKIFSKNRAIYIATRKNMKRLMTQKQGDLFKARSRIETIWGVLKERFKRVYHLARSPHGLFRHYFYSLISFLIYDKKNILLPG